MKPRRHSIPLALVLVASGLIGLGLFAIAEHYRLPIVPANDFARGLWVGICLGAELMGGFILFKVKAGPAS